MKNNLPALLATLLCLTATQSALAYTSSYYTNRSLLSQGHNVKVAVDTTGIFEISYDRLRELGFEDPSKVNVFGYGGVISGENDIKAVYPDDLPQAASVHTADGRLLFYGEGVVRATFESAESYSSRRNYYDTRGFYFLSDNKATEILPTHPYDAFGGTDYETISSGYCMEFRENEVQNPGRGSVYFHDKALSAGEGTSYPFHILDMVEGSKGWFRYDGVALSPSATTTRFQLTSSDGISLQGHSTSGATGTSKSTVLFRCLSGDASVVVSGGDGRIDKHGTITVSVPSNFAGSYAALDKACLIYKRHNRLGELGQLIFNIPSAHADQFFSIAEAGPETEVWNVTDPLNIFRYELSYDEESAVATGSLSNTSVKNPSQLIAFDKSATFREPEIIGEVKHQNIHGRRCPDMIIVSTMSNLKYADELADMHRQQQGLDVFVITQDQAFNEFASGACQPNGIRRMIKMFYDRNRGTLRYLLLYGQPTWDMRGIQRPKEDNLVIYECESMTEAQETTTNYATDFFFGMVADTYKQTSIYRAPTEVSIGRIPANTAAEAHAANKKIKEYLANPPSVKQYMKSLFMSCTGDKYMHLGQSTMASNAMRAASPAFTTIHADNCLFTGDIDGHYPDVSKLVEQTLNSGIGYFTYSGHSNNYALDGTDIWQYHHVERYRYRTWPFAMLASCNTLDFDNYNTGIGEQMFFKPDGGMIGVFGSCRTVYLEHNRSLNTAMAKAYSSATDGTTLGDLPRMARNGLIASNDMVASLGNNSLSYNLCGDPAVPVFAPTMRVVIDRLGDTDITPGVTATASALSKLRVQAHITDVDGKSVDGFNGMATIEIYDTPVSKTFRPDAAKPEQDFQIMSDHTLVASVPAPVIAGRIDHEIVLGNPLNEGGPNRIVITAEENHGATAAGGSKALVVISSDTPADDIDMTAPDIEEMYLDSPSFCNGGTVGRNATFKAVVSPSTAGLDMRFGDIRNQNMLMLDGSVNLTRGASAFEPGLDGRMYLSVPLRDLKPGNHTLSLKVANLLGMSDSGSIEFTVMDKAAEGWLELADSDKPARTTAVLSFECHDPEAEVSRLIITDSEGNTVLSRSQISMPFSWDLSDSHGEALADGLYRAHALYSTPNGKGSTEKIEIVVVR